jgi:hypothetical protein
LTTSTLTLPPPDKLSSKYRFPPWQNLDYKYHRAGHPKNPAFGKAQNQVQKNPTSKMEIGF